MIAIKFAVSTFALAFLAGLVWIYVSEEISARKMRALEEELRKEWEAEDAAELLREVKK